jgi:type II secretory pathway component GspD/PulD (secretin)
VTRTPYLHLALALGLCACQAVRPTIPERQGQPGPSPDKIQLSLLEKYAQELAAARPPAPDTGLEPETWTRPKIGDDELLQVEFRDAPLGQVVQFLADKAGLNLHLDSAADQRVNVSFKSITLDDALHTLLERHRCRLVESPPGVYWVEDLDGALPAVRTFRPRSASVASVVENVRALVASTTTVVVEPSQNLVVVRGPRDDIEIVRDYLSRADRALRQVLIEVRVLEVTLGDTFQLGLTHDIAGSIDNHLFGLMQDLGTNDTSFEFQFTSEDGDVDSTINAIRRLAGTDLVSSPRVLALTGTEASIEVIKEVPYINVTSTQTSSAVGQGTNVVQEVQFKEAGMKMKVSPIVQDDGSVYIKIDQELSEVVDTFNQIPVLDRRSIKSNFVVQDRATVVLGGLMQDKRTQVDKGTPGLMDIPLLGRLFRSDDDKTEKRELLVFLTPRVVEPDEAELLTKVLKNEYSERIQETGVHSHAGPRER